VNNQRGKLIAGIVAILSLIGLALSSNLARAASVPPEFVPGTDNQTCGDFEGVGQNWTELKVDPNANGVYTDGTLTVTLIGLLVV